jgi:transposase-like protein
VAKRKRYSVEQIIRMLREAEVETAKGTKVAQVCRKLGITENTYYRWRREYGGLKLDQAKRFKQIEQENARLKRIVADQQIDIAILKEVANPKF